MSSSATSNAREDWRYSASSSQNGAAAAAMEADDISPWDPADVVPSPPTAAAAAEAPPPTPTPAALASSEAAFISASASSCSSCPTSIASSSISLSSSGAAPRALVIVLAALAARLAAAGLATAARLRGCFRRALGAVGDAPATLPPGVVPSGLGKLRSERPTSVAAASQALAAASSVVKAPSVRRRPLNPICASHFPVRLWNPTPRKALLRPVGESGDRDMPRLLPPGVFMLPTAASSPTFGDGRSSVGGRARTRSVGGAESDPAPDAAAASGVFSAERGAVTATADTGEAVGDTCRWVDCSKPPCGKSCVCSCSCGGAGAGLEALGGGRSGLTGGGGGGPSAGMGSSARAPSLGAAARRGGRVGPESTASTPASPATPAAAVAAPPPSSVVVAPPAVAAATEAAAAAAALGARGRGRGSPTFRRRRSL
mmetsp:Transcript_22654/g.73670  ORF Transcript_22654/g.73670 Transcript_22654/m.73670 type:complete len:430 (+) Transcript_22654:1367-2656(+)